MVRRLFLLLTSLSIALVAADVSGTWEAAVETSAGSGTPTFVLKQEGSKLSGTYSGALGEAAVTGTVNGDQIEIIFEIAPQGDKIKVTYQGKISSETKMAGKLTIPGLAEGTWTATKKKG